MVVFLRIFIILLFVCLSYFISFYTFYYYFKQGKTENCLIVSSFWIESWIGWLIFGIRCNITLKGKIQDQSLTEFPDSFLISKLVLVQNCERERDRQTITISKVSLWFLIIFIRTISVNKRYTKLNFYLICTVTHTKVQVHTPTQNNWIEWWWYKR